MDEKYDSGHPKIDFDASTTDVRKYLQEFYTIVDTIIVGQFLGVKALLKYGLAWIQQWMLLSVFIMSSLGLLD